MTKVPPITHKIRKLSIPPPILHHHQNIQLHKDFLFVNWTPFFHTKSEGVNFLTVEPGRSRKATGVVAGLQKVVSTYELRGFKVQCIHSDNKFNVNKIKRVRLLKASIQKQ